MAEQTVPAAAYAVIGGSGTLSSDFPRASMAADVEILACWQDMVVEVVDCLGRSIGDVNQALVDTHLECLTASLVYVRAFYYCVAAAPRW